MTVIMASWAALARINYCLGAACIRLAQGLYLRFQLDIHLTTNNKDN